MEQMEVIVYGREAERGLQSRIHSSSHENEYLRYFLGLGGPREVQSQTIVEQDVKSNALVFGIVGRRT